MLSPVLMSPTSSRSPKVQSYECECSPYGIPTWSPWSHRSTLSKTSRAAQLKGWVDGMMPIRNVPKPSRHPEDALPLGQSLVAPSPIGWQQNSPQPLSPAVDPTAAPLAQHIGMGCARAPMVPTMLLAGCQHLGTATMFVVRVGIFGMLMEKLGPASGSDPSSPHSTDP